MGVGKKLKAECKDADERRKSQPDKYLGRAKPAKNYSQIMKKSDNCQEMVDYAHPQSQTSHP